MRIVDLLNPNAISLNDNAKNKQDVINKLIALHKKAGNISDAEEFKKEILKREEQGTTAIGEGIAIPHAKSNIVKTPGLSAITIENGVDYNSLDGKTSDILFMIAAPMDGDIHLEVLSRLMTLLMDENLRKELKKAKTRDEFLNAVDKAETERFDEPKTENSNESQFKVLAVTACPTGIAHTYMAAEALEKAGKALNYPLKAETNGSGGAKNILTPQEISDCDGIIIAADKSVEMSRFDGKPVISVPVSEGIHKPEELINKIKNGEASVYHHTGEKKAVSNEKESFGRQIYKHLMNGVSHMLPFVVAGGIFIALAFLIDTAMGVNPQEAGGNFGVVTPVAAWLKNIGGYAFNFMIPILAGFIAMSIADRPGLLVGIVGGFLATNGATFTDPGAVKTVPSGFLGALLAGFAAGYLMRFVEKLCDKLPRALEGIKPVLIYPLSGLGIVAIMMCAVNPIMGIINSSLNSGLTWLSENNLGILLGAIVAGMMAIDMGGPFNKAAYVFGSMGLAAATTASYEIMAAVMIGGMVPPIAIALSTTFSKKRWTEDERKNGIVNYIMGLSFITEGAIPYAASYPLAVIPSCIVGSAIAGALSVFFKCTLMAPHGGIFVFAVVGNWYWYLLALAAGSIVSTLLLALLKKRVK